MRYWCYLSLIIQLILMLAGWASLPAFFEWEGVDAAWWMIFGYAITSATTGLQFVISMKLIALDKLRSQPPERLSP